MLKIKWLVLIALLLLSILGKSQSVKFLIDSRLNVDRVPLQVIRSNGLRDTIQTFVPESLTIQDYEIPVKNASILKLNDSLLVVSKSDSIYLRFDPQLKKYTIIGGKYTNSYRFLAKLNAEYFKMQRFNTFNGDFKSFVSLIKKRYKDKLSTLDSLAKNEVIAEDVFNLFEDYIKCNEVLSVLSSINPSNAKQLWPLIGETWNLETFAFLKNPRFDDMQFYHLATFSFLLCQSFNDNTSRFEFHFFKTLMVNDFKKQTKLALLNSFFNNNSLPFDMSKQDLSYTFKAITNLGLTSKEIVPFKRSYARYIINGLSIPDSIQRLTKFITTQGKHTSLKDILNDSKGKKVLIDFWASWCGPCIKRLPEVKEFSEAREDISVIYISLDNDGNKWKAAYEKNKIRNKQYLLLNNFNSSFAKYLVLEQIPHYILLSNDGKLKTINQLSEIPNI